MLSRCNWLDEKPALSPVTGGWGEPGTGHIISWPAPMNECSSRIPKLPEIFDKVPLTRILSNNSSHRIRGQVLLWIKNDGKQRVGVNGQFSQWRKVSSGVP